MLEKFNISKKFFDILLKYFLFFTVLILVVKTQGFVSSVTVVHLFLGL